MHGRNLSVRESISTDRLFGLLSVCPSQVKRPFLDNILYAVVLSALLRPASPSLCSGSPEYEYCCQDIYTAAGGTPRLPVSSPFLDVANFVTHALSCRCTPMGALRLLPTFYAPNIRKYAEQANEQSSSTEIICRSLRS
jgi:hypothetical protein